MLTLNNKGQLASSPMVLIMMGTCNGEKYLRDQLDSIAAQTHTNWRLVVSDDGSEDGTQKIVECWAGEIGSAKVLYRDGPQKGFAQNFLSMASDKTLQADFYAFCDQDDVWEEEKLEAALMMMQRPNPSNQPLLYCGRTKYVNEQLIELGYSKVFNKPPGFKNALVQCIAGGNTMVFNQRLKESIEISGSPPVVSHDWWVYQLTCGSGGSVLFDTRPFTLYRQHASSAVGENVTLKAIIKRLRMAVFGDLKKSIDTMLYCLKQSSSILSNEALETATVFDRLRNGNLWSRVVGTYRLGVSRQTFLENLGLYLCLIIKKV
jgi:glycosyltransferase involved in cell wall biosynthesis